MQVNDKAVRPERSRRACHLAARHRQFIPGGLVAYNGQETRFYLIGPVLRAKGYDDYRWLKMETAAPVEPTGPKGRRRKGADRTDYLICVQAGDLPKPLPVGVVEVKREEEDPLKGMQQA